MNPEVPRFHPFPSKTTVERSIANHEIDFPAPAPAPAPAPPDEDEPAAEPEAASADKLTGEPTNIMTARDNKTWPITFISIPILI